ncbi:MAG: hypothetical protein HYX61_02615 [Gammaproteobacteria bacterium]|jgi:intracellular multiplication protein IcmC|nr:hypothetical protein [Gammaproteobacteria bacterium]
MSGSSGIINADAFSLTTALTNLNNAFTSIEHLIVAVSYVIGLSLMVRGVMMYKALATQTMSSAQKGEFAGPLVFIIVGGILVYFPSTLTTSLSSVFVTSDISPASELIGYQSLSGSEKWQQISTVVIEYMKLIGLIAFVRGWVILSKMGHSGSQPGSVGKGLIHLIGGVLLINVVETVAILACTFGYTGAGAC